MWSIDRWQTWAASLFSAVRATAGTEGHTVGAAMSRGHGALLQLDLASLLGSMGHWAFLDLSSVSHRWLERRGSLQRFQQALEALFHVLTF